MYNVENYIGKCLDTLVNQTFEDFDIIIIDDGSKDNSYARAVEYQKKYSEKIRVYKQENSGQGAVRNNGVRLATGDYIMFVDSDDTVTNDFVEKAYNAIKDSDADLGIFDAVVVDENGKRIEDMIGCHCAEQEFSLETFPQLLFEYPAPWNKIYKRNFLIDNELGYPTHMWYEDLVGAIRFFATAKKIVYIKEQLYYYMQRSNSVMHSKIDEKNIEILKAMDLVMEFFKEKDIYDKYYKELEYVGIYHVLVAAAGRTVKADAKSEFPPKFVAYMNEKFPKWEQNKYVDNLSLMNKIKLKLLKKGRYSTIHMMYKFTK